MTDNEIVKALECCGSDKGNLCTLCPRIQKFGDNCNENDLFIEALNLINRQKAEIEQLKVTKSEAIKEFAEMVKKKFLRAYVATEYIL